MSKIEYHYNCKRDCTKFQKYMLFLCLALAKKNGSVLKKIEFKIEKIISAQWLLFEGGECTHVHPSTNPARQGLTSELVCLCCQYPRLKIP